MSLDYNLTKIKDRDLSDEGWAVTQAIIFSCLNTGIGEITEKNAAEFYARMAICERVMGPMLTSFDGGITPRYITPDEVRAHIGLHTNVAPEETRTKWLRRIIGGRLQDYTTEYRRATRRAKEGATDGG